MRLFSCCATNEATKDNVASVQKGRTAVWQRSAEMWGNYSRYSRITSTKSLSFCMKNPLRESHTTYAPPTSFTWL